MPSTTASNASVRTHTCELMLVRGVEAIMLPHDGASAQLHFCTWQSRPVCRPSSGGRACSQASESSRDPSSSRTCVGVDSAERRPSSLLGRGHGSPPYVRSSPNETASWWAIAATVDCRAPRSCCATHTNNATLSRSTPRSIGIMGDQGLSASSMLAVPSLVQLICRRKQLWWSRRLAR